MKKAFQQYPDVYSKDDTRYTYYTDSRQRVTLVAGEDGVTEEWIVQLKEMHREEYNMMRRGRSKGENSILMSLTLIEDDLGDKARVMGQSGNSAEEVCLERHERRRIRRRVRSAYRGLTREQRELLIEVRFRGRSMTEVAVEQNVTRQAVKKRLDKIESTFKKDMRGVG